MSLSGGSIELVVMVMLVDMEVCVACGMVACRCISYNIVARERKSRHC